MIQTDDIEEVIKKRGVYVGTVHGNSMFPMLRNRKDTVIIRPLTGKLKKYDIPLYRKGNMYVLHRIVEVTPDTYVICGDNCAYMETDVTEEQIIGKLEGFYRGKKQISMNGILYKTYCRMWVLLYPARCVVEKIRNKWRI